MIDSILDSIKKSLGVELDFDGFDTEIIMGINTSIMALSQICVGLTDPFVVTGLDEVWSDLLISDLNIEAAKSYITLKTRLLFDPPSSSFVIEAMNKQIDEIGWRLVVQTEPVPEPIPEPEE